MDEPFITEEQGWNAGLSYKWKWIEVHMVQEVGCF